MSPTSTLVGQYQPVSRATANSDRSECVLIAAETSPMFTTE